MVFSCSKIKLDNLINLKEIEFGGVDIGIIDLKNQTKLTKLIYQGDEPKNSLINISLTLKELYIEDYGDDLVRKTISSTEIKNLINLEKINISWFNLDILDLSKMEKLNYIFISDIYGLSEIIHPSVILNELMVQTVLNIPRHVITRRRIYLLCENKERAVEDSLSENSQNRFTEICKKCNKKVLNYKKINIRNILHDSYSFSYILYNSCC